MFLNSWSCVHSTVLVGGFFLSLLALYSFNSYSTLVNSHHHKVYISAFKTSNQDTNSTLTASNHHDCEEKVNNQAQMMVISSVITEATSGREFSGVPFRSFPKHKRKFNVKLTASKMAPVTSWNCTKWGVVTTVFSPPKQEAVRRFMYRKDWCVVVAGDKIKPKVSTTMHG